MYLIVTRSFPPELGGMQSLMWGLSKELSKNYMIKVFADYTENHKTFDEQVSFSIERVGGIKLFRKYRKANRIAEYIKENKNVRSIFFDHWKSVEKINSQAIENFPTFCLIHSKEINHSKGSMLNKRVLDSIKKVKYVIANSNFTKKLAIMIGVPEKKIYKNSFPKILTVARLDKRKNHQNILMCIRNLKEKFPKIKYVSVGDGEEKKRLLALIKELKIENEVVFLDRTDQKLKAALIKNSNLFLMPSIIFKKSVEGFGISFIEAASYGVGSIGGRDGGASDAINNEKTGLICDGQNINSIYESILKFFENENYKTYGANALTFSKNFNWNKIVKKYLNLT